MNWIYYILHEWPQNEKMAWAEALVLPHDLEYTSEAIWVTIDSLGSFHLEDSGHKELHDLCVKLIGDKEFWIKDEEEKEVLTIDSDMVVRQYNFTKDEFLHYLKIWIESKVMKIESLLEGKIIDFAGRHSIADAYIEMQKKI
jgi:hypothetical protein